MKKKYIIICAVIVVVITIVLLFVSKIKTTITNKNYKISLYTVPSSDKVFVNGVITPENTENIFLDSTKGNVNKVSITNGQVVKKGDTLFTYKNDQITDQITQLNSQVTSSANQKNKLIDKQTKLKNDIAADPTKGVGSDSILSGYQDQIDTIESQISTYEDQIKPLKEKEYTVVNSPIDGKVLVYDSAKDPTKPYMVVESTTYYIKGSANEKDQPKLKENQKSEILIFATNKTLTGKVKSIGNRPQDAVISTQVAASGSSNNMSYYDVDISVDSQDSLINGFHVQATVKLTDDSIKIPSSSIYEEYGKKYVYKVVDKKLTKQEITCEDSTSSDFTVSAGLKEGDSIAKNAKGMKEGTIVE